MPVQLQQNSAGIGPFVPVIVLLFAIGAAAQSGRIKPEATPTPEPSISTGYRPTRTDAEPTPKPTPEPKQTDEVVRVSSMLVPIPVSVFDSRGRAVTTLKKSDLEVRVDGKAVEIDEVFRSRSPIRLAMLFDNSSSILAARDFERDAAVRFFTRVLRPEIDQAALFSVADYTRLSQPLTANTTLLTHAINAFPPPAGATALLDGIIEAAEYLKAYSGRRVIVIVSDGEDTYSELSTTLEGVVKTLQQTNCQVYVVKTKDFENFKRTGSREGNANIRSLTAERRMIEIAQQTGGAVFSPIDEREMNEAFDDISASLSQQYILAYYPDDTAAEAGAFREITVKVNGRSGLTVRTRKGYYVPKRP
ncbi:MAG: VWA domain-containing protein [Acidobacteria bacterium ACB1]|nr:VWA domain-containing protein [Acidobacteriota bacterium]MCE7963665.1 VWA domain-containing protein [Acidobacteria bacterium ACB1]